MRRQRRRTLNKFVDVTIRCIRSEHRLRPDDERVNILGFWLAKARISHPGVVILAVMQMSTHVHLVLWDREAQLSDFMRDLESCVSRSINRLDHVRGPFFERRFAEIEILDRASVAKRIAYAICNPVESNLVRRWRDWKGLCMFGGANGARKSFTVFREWLHREAVKEAERLAPNGAASVRRADFVETATLELGVVEAGFAAEIAIAVGAREKELRTEQKGVLGMDLVLSTPVFKRPKRQERSRMPLVFGATLKARIAYAIAWRGFVNAYRDASDAFRSGVLSVAFPRGSFRPFTFAGISLAPPST